MFNKYLPIFFSFLEGAGWPAQCHAAAVKDTLLVRSYSLGLVTEPLGHST